MAELNMDFDPGAVELTPSFDPLPVGDYIAQITESDVQVPKSGNGLMLKVVWEVVEGPYEKRKIFQNINYQHNSEQAQAIGQRQLAEICRAVGHAGQLNNSDVLHYHPVKIRVIIETDASGRFAPKNVIRAVVPMPSGAQPVAQPAAAQPAPAQAAPKPTAARPVATATPRPWRS